MRYYIDYRNGSMGHTILAHALYACNQVDIDLTALFSDTGNAHNIRVLNSTALDAKHLIEYPIPGANCVIEVIPDAWAEILRVKLSYSKWIKDVPRRSNAGRFFPYKVNPDWDQLWQDFYQAYKDPSWPECLYYRDLDTLPPRIQQEIQSVYQEPVLELTTENGFAEWLTICYFDHLGTPLVKNFSNARELKLQDYIDGNIDVLKEVCEQQLNWNWVSWRSDTFRQAMIGANQEYLVWLDNIKHAAQCVLDNNTIDTNFDTWEQALIIAKICTQYNIDPKIIKWDNVGCNSTGNNLYLENFKRTYHGKTI